MNQETKSQNINVIIHLPEEVSEIIKQQKINRIYDILNPKDEKTA